MIKLIKYQPPKLHVVFSNYGYCEMGTGATLPSCTDGQVNNDSCCNSGSSPTCVCIIGSDNAPGPCGTGGSAGLQSDNTCVDGTDASTGGSS